MSRDVVFKKFIFPFKSWISKYVNAPSSSFHCIFPPRPSILHHSSKIPNASTEFSPPISFSVMAVPSDDFPDLVHPTDVSSQVDSLDGSSY